MMMKFLESKRRQVILGNLLWLVVFLFQSVIIFGLLKYFFDFSFQFTYLQVCVAHLIIRMVRDDLPTETIPLYFQGKMLSDVDKEIKKLNDEIKKLEL
tara:strand:- start:200 stop:493 length:294 start_codon:yes stop_codon:yes gene_type:complete